jgi:lipoprotein NlpD
MNAELPRSGLLQACMPPLRPRLRLQRAACLNLLALCAVLAGCASQVSHRAPVEDRGSSSSRPAAGGAGTTTTTTTTTNPAAGSPAVPATGAVAGAADNQPTKPLPGAENGGKPGYYTVKPGDTLIRISLDSGQNWRDVARWSNLENANLIEVGQVLRVWPPGADSPALTRPMTPPGRVETRPLEPPRPGAPVPTAPGTTPATASAASPTTVPPITGPVVAPIALPAAATASTPTAAAPAPQPPREGDDDVNWGWPTAATVSTAFDEARNKGVLFAGKAGDPVLAAADGRVAYAGSGLRGYGNLVIVRHNGTYLTAYAHNQVLLVKEDQPVRRGQRIAEMGATEADRVQLHFEIRRFGKPVDPVRLLPAR